MKILCLVDLLGASSDQDFASDLKTMEWKTESHVMSALKKLGHEAKLFGVAGDVLSLLDELNRFRPDVVFNLCEAFAGDRSLESSIPNLLLMLGVPFTGCSPQVLALCKDKSLTNAIVSQAGVRVPNSLVVRKNEKFRASSFQSYPAFVKPCTLESSQGLSQKSKVRTVSQLADRIAHLQKSFGQDVLVQQYIDGRELYVSTLCDQGKICAVFPVRELHFGALRNIGQGFATYRGKWDEEYRKKWNIHSRPVHELSPGVQQELDFALHSICAKLQITGYVRMDFRVCSSSDQVYFLEINPNPALARDDEFALAAKAAGFSYPALISEILELCATKNAKRRVSDRLWNRLGELSKAF